jgi:hypothetical protein
MSNVKWTETDIRILREVYPVTRTWDTIQEALPLYTRTAIAAKAFNLGLHKPRDSYNVKNELDHDLFSTWDERSAYLLGYLEADGSVRQRSTGSLLVTFATSVTDTDYLLRLKRLVGYTGVNGTNQHMVEGQRYITARFAICSRQWAIDLSGNLRVGHIPSSIPLDLQHHYVRGYFDGDGSVYRSNNQLHVGFVCNSKTLTRDLRDLIAASIKDSRGMTIRQKTNSAKCWYFRLTRKAMVSALFRWLYVDASIFLPRKRDIFMGVFGG